jgi:hypothetical protein
LKDKNYFNFFIYILILIISILLYRYSINNKYFYNYNIKNTNYTNSVKNNISNQIIKNSLFNACSENRNFPLRFLIFKISYLFSGLSISVLKYSVDSILNSLKDNCIQNWEIIRLDVKKFSLKLG